jgi:hypothetical protein
MSYDYLKAYLDVTTSPEQSDVLIQACTLLHDAGVSGHDYALEQELALGDDSDTSTTLQSIYNCINPLMHIVIANFGITLVEEANLSQLVDILNGLLLIDNYGDPVTLVNLCDGLNNPEEALSDILTYVGALSAGEYLTLIESVNPSFLEKIVETLQSNNHGMDDDEPQPLQEAADYARLRLRSYVSSFPVTLAKVAVVNGMRLGLPFDLTIETQVDQLGILMPDQVPNAVLGLALASDLPDDQLFDRCMLEIDALLNDMAKVNAARLQLTQLIEGLTHVKA